MKKTTLIQIFVSLSILCATDVAVAETVQISPELIGNVIASSGDGVFDVEISANPENKPTGMVAIPAETVIDGKTYRATEIAESGFSGCDLTMVTFPPTLHKIGKLAFFNCKKLTNAVETTHGSVTTLSYDSFRNTKSLVSVYFPSVVYIPDDAFYGSGLVSADFPAACVIGERAFYECNNLGSVTMSPELNTIGANAFLSCYSLKYIELTHKLQTIGIGAFRFCYSLEFIVIPRGVSSIGDDAFSGCAALKTVYLLNPEYTPDADGSRLLNNSNIETVYCVNNLKPLVVEFYKNNESAPQVRLMSDIVKPVLLSTSAEGYRFKLEALVGDVLDLKVSPFDDIYSYLSMDSDGAYCSPVSTIHLEYSIGAWKPMWYDEQVNANSGVESVVANQAEISVAVDGSCVAVNGADGLKVDVYSMQGARVGSADIIDGVAMIDLSCRDKGIYLVKVGSRVTKVCLN